MKFRKPKANATLADFFSLNFGQNNLWEYKAEDIDLLAELVDFIRPKYPEAVLTMAIGELLDLLRDNERYCTGLALYVKGLLKNKKFSKILTDAGILTDADFFYEVRKRLTAKLIPNQPGTATLEYVLNQVFYRKNDPVWLDRIPYEQLDELFTLLGFRHIYASSRTDSPLSQLLFSIEVLIHRITGRALESQVMQMVPEYENLESPFLAIQREFALLAEKLMQDRSNFIDPQDLGYKQLMLLHGQCRDFVERAFKNSARYGISLRVNQNLLRIRQQLNRLRTLLPLLVLREPSDARRNSIYLSLDLIAYNCQKNNVRGLVNDSTQLLSYEITQHTANTGEHYITSNRREYFRMFRDAAGGGAIVAAMCIIKLFLGKVHTSDFGHAFLYSMNYSAGFIAIYLTGCTLATKQPAMTASALVRALEGGRRNKDANEEDKHHAFAEFFARVFRSQFIAFAGNVLVAFPVALLLIWGIDRLFAYNAAAAKWFPLVNDLSPVDSPAIFHAAIAGVFLFLSGIIAGSVANRDKHANIYYRIKEHPVLKKTFGKTRTAKLAQWYERRWAGIVSNFWFGIFMGSTASLGAFLGLGLDIRHITFASGNLALGLYGKSFNVPAEMVGWGITGIVVIGLVNFAVSFGLSLMLAFRSRKIPLSELAPIAHSVWAYFKYRPGAFFIPPFRQKRS